MPKMTPEMIVQRLLDSDGDSDGLPKRLLEAMCQGFPVTNLEPLLRHPSSAIALDAGWILSELGKKGAELIDLSVELLSHPLEEMRADAISNLLANVGRCGSEAAWNVISRYSTETSRIKEEIVNYLARVPIILLRDAVSIGSGADVSSHVSGFRLHLSPAAGHPILDALASEDAVIRAYAIAATRRLELFVVSAWRTARRSEDPVLQALAKLWLPK